MNAMTKPSPAVLADVHWRIGSACPSRPCRDYTIDIDRGYSIIGPRVEFYETIEAAREGSPQILEFWDRPSFRKVYRYARIWRIGGIGHRVLKGGAA
ncbi:MAG: hypothetical protein HQL35_04805 [Alphaproteobacteria bacterium]|nr:hypothetical protein [Alphaproteobacteria bacterium]